MLQKFPETISFFKKIGSTQQVSDEFLVKAERYVCLLYNQLNDTHVDKARYNIFRIGKYFEDVMPCTRNVLYHHLMRVNFQTFVWKQAISSVVNLPNIQNAGWRVAGGNMEILWMSIPIAPEGLVENTHCSCKSGCNSRRCLCSKANLKCTSVCRCSGCENRNEEDAENSESELSEEESDEDSDNE